MSGLDKDMNVKMNLHLDMLEIIMKFWSEHGLIDKYGREFLQWILEFTVPDLLENELKDKSAIAGRIREAIKEYNLDKYKGTMSVISRKRYKELQKI